MNSHATRTRARRFAASLIAATVTVTTGAVAATEAEAASIYGGLTTTEIASGLTLPVNTAFADSDRIYVAEKAGLVKMLDDPGDASATTTLDLRTDVYDHWDRGLLGIALDPAFDEGSPYLYVFYTWDRDPFGDGQVPWCGVIALLPGVGGGQAVR